MSATARMIGFTLGVAVALGAATAASAHSHARSHNTATTSALASSVMRARLAGHHETSIAFYTGGPSGFRHLAWQHYSRHARFAGRVGHSGGGLQCVTFARADSGIELSGNASAWWYNAAGVYQRGSRPEPGSVLNFRANGAMRMGHVAVVNDIIDSRTVEIDHANWGGPGAGRGRVSRDIRVVDVSPDNDWTAVRVGLGHTEEYGSIYPTYGFIYNRPDPGTMVASAGGGAPIPALNRPPRDLRGSARDTSDYDEVAEAPDSVEPRAYHHAVYHRHHHVAARHHHL